MEQRLRLELDGVGIERLPDPVQRQQQIDTARLLVAADLGNPVGNLVLGQAALRDVLYFSELGPGGMTDRELHARYGTGRFDHARVPMSTSCRPARAVWA